MNRELEALDRIWYHLGTDADYQTLKNAIEALKIVKLEHLINLEKQTDSVYCVKTPSCIFYVSKERYNLLMDVFYGSILQK